MDRTVPDCSACYLLLLGASRRGFCWLCRPDGAVTKNKEAVRWLSLSYPMKTGKAPGPHRFPPILSRPVPTILW